MGECDEAIAAVFGLGKCERKALSSLCKKERDAASLARLCGKSCPRMAQVLSGLLEKKLVKRRKIPLPRGYKYAYSASGRAQLAKEAKKALMRRQKDLLSRLSS